MLACKLHLYNHFIPEEVLIDPSAQDYSLRQSHETDYFNYTVLQYVRETISATFLKIWTYLSAI